MMDGKRLQASTYQPYILPMIIITLLGVVSVTAGVVFLLHRWGLEAMLILLVTASGAAWGWVIRWLWKDGRITLSHLLVIWMVWTGTVLSGASYYLAYRGIGANLETLSRYVMVEVVAGIGGYFVKSGVEHVVLAKSTRDNDRKVQKKDLI